MTNLPSEPDVRELLHRAADGLRAGHVDAAFDELFASVDSLVEEKRFERIDELLLAACDMNDAPLKLKLLVGLLTITLPLRDRLRERSALVRATRAHAERVGGAAKAWAVLRGLE